MKKIIKKLIKKTIGWLLLFHVFPLILLFSYVWDNNPKLQTDYITIYIEVVYFQFSGLILVCTAYFGYKLLKDN